jgi:hypothetical protein
LAGLQRVLNAFKAAGFRVGLHFLAASVYPPDAYLTPVPDARLVKGASTTLAADVDATTGVLPVTTRPEGFPETDGGYMGDGTVLQIGNELITYGTRSLKEPWEFAGCRRGHLNTRPAAHRKGEPVRHLVRSYGYHMYDLNTSLRDEVAANFAAVADAAGIDMAYFDGAERLQGEHWYYNARLLDTFYRHLKNPNLLLQASSYTHYSWHLLARSASADGHGDLKGYLDQRSGGFSWMRREGMPLDIGWYYGYDPTATPDMFEYVLGATLAYDSSMSFQVSCKAAAAHPFTAEILDLISRYERLRLSGRVPDQVKAALTIPPPLTAIKPGEAQPELVAQRREYRLLEREGAPVLQRVIYGPWQELKPGDTNAAACRVRGPEEPAAVGLQIHAPAGVQLNDPVVALGDQKWAWQGTLTNGQFLFFWPGESIARYAPELERPERGARCPEVTLAGEHRAVFTAGKWEGGTVRVRFTFQPSERLELRP